VEQTVERYRTFAELWRTADPESRVRVERAPPRPKICRGGGPVDSGAGAPTRVPLSAVAEFERPIGSGARTLHELSSLTTRSWGISMASIKARLALSLCASALSAVGCGPTDSSPGGSEAVPAAENRLVDLLKANQPVFGLISGEKTAESAMVIGRNLEVDYVFYSLEDGPFDIPTMEMYVGAMAEVAGAADSPSVMLRVPPIRDDREAALEHVRAGLEAGARAIAFPHVESVQDVELAIRAIGDRLWPMNPNGDVLNVVMIEDRGAVASVREIVSTPGVSVVFPGPGDLLTAYDGDEVAVEDAIQAILAACLEFDVPCMMTGDSDDLADRLEQGFSFFVLTDTGALATGWAVSGRTR
jgi:2-keto-3-deoxy-L-rhamnonate aldolase RhmA